MMNVKGRAPGLIPGEEFTTVAVKMLKVYPTLQLVHYTYIRTVHSSYICYLVDLKGFRDLKVRVRGFGILRSSSGVLGF